MIQGNAQQQQLGFQSNHAAGRKRPAMVPNYHTLSNNAVLPSNDVPDVQHYHTKVIRDRAPKLAPTLRQEFNSDTAQLYNIGGPNTLIAPPPAP